MNYIGIDIGGTNLKAGLVNDEGSILAMEKRKIAEVSDQKALVEALVALTQSLTERGGLTPEQIEELKAAAGLKKEAEDNGSNQHISSPKNLCHCRCTGHEEQRR